MLTGLLAVLLAAAPSGAAAAASQDADPYLWLEEVRGQKALEWVRRENERTLGPLQADARFAPTEKAIREILTAKDRIASPQLAGDWVYNFWQDETNVRGLWRRATIAEYQKSDPAWQVVLDLDAL